MAKRTGFEVDEDGQIDKTVYSADRLRRVDHANFGEEMSALAKQLYDLKDLAAIPMTGQLREAIELARSISSKKKALSRQMKYVARLLRAADLEAIEEALGGAGPQSAEQQEHFALLERWRTKIIDDDAAIDNFVEAHPQADRQRIRKQARQVRKALGSPKELTARKQLFQVLRAESE